MYHASLPQKFHQAMPQKCRDISSAFSRFIIQAENCFSRLTRNPDGMAKLHEAAMQCREEAWELEIIFFFLSLPLSYRENFYPSVLPRDTLNMAKPRFRANPPREWKSRRASQLVTWNSIWVERQNWAADRSHPCLFSNVWLRVVSTKSANRR